MTLVFFAMFGTFFLAAQYLQLVLGYSALESGLFQLPMAALMMVVSPQVPGFVARFGARRIVPAGLGFISLGLMLFSLMGTDTRSEERRVGKECVSTCRSRWSLCH